MAYKGRIVDGVGGRRERIQLVAVPFVEPRGSTERAAIGTGHHDDFAVDFDRSRGIIGRVIIWEVRTFRPYPSYRVVDCRVARRTITAPGVINGSVRAENGGPDLVASTPGAAIGEPQMPKCTAGGAPGLGGGGARRGISSPVFRPST